MTKQFESILTERLMLHNNIDEIPQLNDFIKSVLLRLGIDMFEILQLQLAVEEAVVNVMNYAYPADTQGDVSIEVMADGHCLQFVITDSGIPFDPTAKEKADITLTAEERQIGGLGILLMREIMDDATYERRDGKNILTLTKKYQTINNNEQL